MNQRIFVILVLLLKIISAENDSDGIPVFKKCSEYGKHIEEDLEVGSIVMEVSATVDNVDDVVIEYSLMSNDRFKIDAISGQITTNYMFDRDEPKNESEELITVCATNKNNHELKGTCNIEIIIDDINDNSPIFQQTHYQYFVLIDSTVHDMIFKVEATDIDHGNNSIIIYGTDSEIFSISDNGTIFLEHIVDKKVGDVYNVTVTASNEDERTTVLISLTVVSENPNAVTPNNQATNDQTTGKNSLLSNDPDVDTDDVSGNQTLTTDSSLLNITDTEIDKVNDVLMNETITSDDTITNLKKMIVGFLMKDYNLIAFLAIIIIIMINILVCCCCFCRSKRISHDFTSTDNSLYFFGREKRDSFSMVETKAMNNYEPTPKRYCARNCTPEPTEEQIYHECAVGLHNDTEVYDHLTYNGITTNQSSSTPNDSFYKKPTTFIPNRIIFPELHARPSVSIIPFCQSSNIDLTPDRTSAPCYANIPINVRK